MSQLDASSGLQASQTPQDEEGECVRSSQKPAKTNSDATIIAKLVGTLSARVEHLENALCKVSRTIGDMEASRQHQQLSRTRQAIASLRRVVSNTSAQHHDSFPAGPKITRDSKHASTSTNSGKKRQSRIPRPIAVSGTSSASRASVAATSSPLLKVEAASSKRYSAIPRPTQIPGSLHFLHGETRSHERYAKSWAIAAAHAAERASQHQKLALTAVKAFDQLLDDMMNDPQLAHKIELERSSLPEDPSKQGNGEASQRNGSVRDAS